MNEFAHSTPTPITIFHSSLSSHHIVPLCYQRFSLSLSAVSILEPELGKFGTDDGPIA
jgi:hypothetical protein